MPQFNISVFLVGCVGGLLPDVLRLVKGRFNEKAFKEYVDSKSWIFTPLLALLGGFVVWLLNIQDATGAIAYGFSAPQIIESLAAKKLDSAKPVEPTETDRIEHVSTGGKAPKARKLAMARKGEFSIRSWWAY